jgi:xanthine dehydrogenase accessory factor
VHLIDIKELAAWLEDLSKTKKGLLEAVVASMGHYDEEALTLLAKIRPGYLGLVASRKRGQTVMEFLKDSVNKEDLARVRNPAGLDISAKTPNEVAISILAEMIQLRRRATGVDDLENLPVVRKLDAVDPVCGMSVDIAIAKHSYEFEGTVYYFCCPHCRKRFVDNPQKYLVVSSYT